VSVASQNLTPGADDRVSNVLKWVLLAVAIVSFGLLAWATARTSKGRRRNPPGMPPQPAKQ
jgi:nitric oxide reductase subunit B